MGRGRRINHPPVNLVTSCSSCRLMISQGSLDHFFSEVVHVGGGVQELHISDTCPLAPWHPIQVVYGKSVVGFTQEVHKRFFPF